MSIFVARFFKKYHDSSSLKEICSGFLPRNPVSSKDFILKNGDLSIFSFNAALDREPLISSESEIIFLQGYGSKSLESRVRDRFFEKKPLDLINFPEAFCAVKINDYGLSFGGSSVGIDPIFYYVDDDVVVVSNRHNLLGPWAATSELRKDAFAWMVGRGHIGDFGTYWNKVRKTRPGTFYEFDKTSFYEVASDYSGLFLPIENEEISHRIQEVSDDFCNILDASKSDCRFWLSGGKDSRAIAGMLSKARRFSEITFQTHGEKFSPDVMAASLVAKSLGVSNKHTTMRSSLTEPTINFSQGIARDLLSDCSGGALADFRSIPNSDLLIFGGHESGYKIPPNELDIDSYLKSRKYWPDNHNSLTVDAYNKIYKEFCEELRAILEPAPVSRYSQLESLVYIIGTRVTGSHSNSHVSRSEIHPFLDGRFARILLGISDEALKNQIIHYLMMRQASSSIESLPFAADSWPVGAVDFAAHLNLPFRDVPQAPYKFMDYFPSQKKFGGYSWRLDLIRLSRGFVENYIKSNKDFFDFISIENLNKNLDFEISNLKISSIYFHLGLLKACLIHYFHKKGYLFDFKNENLIAREVEDLFLRSKVERMLEDPIDLYKRKLDDYENAISVVAERDRVKKIEERVTVNFEVAKFLARIDPCAADWIETQMREVGFLPLPKEGVNLKLNKYDSTIVGYIVNTSKDSNRLLLAVKNRPKNNPLIGFSWSDVGGFWFKYLNDAALEMKLQLDLKDEEEAWLMPWYSQAPIFFAVSAGVVA